MLGCDHSQWMLAAGMDMYLTPGHLSIQCILLYSVPGALAQVGDTGALVYTTQAVPSSSISVTPASTMTGHSQTLISTTPLSYPGAPMPLTQLPVGTAVKAVNLEASRQAWLGLMKDRVNKLLDMHQPSYARSTVI